MLTEACSFAREISLQRLFAEGYKFNNTRTSFQTFVSSQLVNQVKIENVDFRLCSAAKTNQTMLEFEGSEKEYEHILKSYPDKLLVIDFFAEWCGPCRHMKPYLRECDEKYPEIVIVKVDVDANEAVANKENIEVMPTVIFYKNGMKLGEFSGSSKEALMNKIQEFLNDK